MSNNRNPLLCFITYAMLVVFSFIFAGILWTAALYELNAIMVCCVLAALFSVWTCGSMCCDRLLDEENDGRSYRRGGYQSKMMDHTSGRIRIEHE